MTLQEIFENAPREVREAIQNELGKFKEWFNTDIKDLSAQQLSALLAQLSAEKSTLSVKTIQLETQLEHKRKELENKVTEVLDRYGIKDIAVLAQKKEQIEQELGVKFLGLKNILEKKEVTI